MASLIALVSVNLFDASSTLIDPGISQQLRLVLQDH